MSSKKSGGVGFLGLLTILFIGLKLGGVIDWSWWLVLLPLYGIPAALAAFVLVLGMVIGTCGIIAVAAEEIEKKSKGAK